MLIKNTIKKLAFCVLLCSFSLSQSMALEAGLRQCGFVFLRHGQTAENLQGIIQGTRNTVLNETGRQEAEAAGRALFPYRHQIKRIVSSPLARAYETAQIVAKIIEFQGEIELEDGLKERSMGDWEGVSNTGQGTQADLREGDAPHGETRAHFHVRVLESLRKTITGPGVLVVSHGGVFNTLNSAMGLGVSRAKNAVPFHVYREGDDWQFHELKADGALPPLPEAWYTHT